MCIYCCFLVIRRKRERHGRDAPVQLDDIGSANTAVGTDNLIYQNLAGVQQPGKGRVFSF